VHKQKETTKGIAVMTTSILPTASTSTLAKLHWLKINAYMGYICISMMHLPLMKNQNRCVYQLYFQDYQISLITICPYKRNSLLLKSGLWLCNTRETSHKTSVVTGKIAKIIELYHTRCPLRDNKYGYSLDLLQCHTD
jgi:hypothetical protein